MPKFKYVAKDKNAQAVAGVIETTDASAVVRELKKQELVVISVTEEKAEAAKPGVGPAAVVKAKSVGNIKPMDLVVFSRQLSTLIDSGISLVMGLNILYEQVENPNLKRLVIDIKNDIEAGNSLSGSFSKYPSFPPIFSNMIRAGESSGSLNEILERVAEYLERMENLRRKIQSALVYPILVISMAILIDAFLMLKVVPTFKNIFESMKGEMPAPTLLLITMSNVSVRFFPFIIGGFVLIGFLFTRYINTDSGRINFDAVKLKFPVVGPIISKIAISKFTRTLATLVRSGVSILEAFEISGKVSGNKVIEKATEQIGKNIMAGENISEPMAQTGKFPPFVVKMISVGEQTGELEKMLTKISDYYEEQVNESLNGLTSMIEPAVIIFLGGSIGFIVLAMFLPIFKLSQLLNR
jgi:type IV pilus assembly protein PilC